MANKEIDLKLLKMLSEMASLPDKLTLEDIFEMAWVQWHIKEVYS